jgi:alcohol dehydrogenase (cytochrome c)
MRSLGVCARSAVALLAAVLLSGAAPRGADVGWGGYNNDLQGRRWSPLDQVNVGNVARLKPVCELKMGERGPFQTGPVVVGDTMFLTTAHTTVAMDATTCAVRWRHLDSRGAIEPLNVNRGVAYAAGRLFRGMPGAKLAALDATTGKVVWEVQVGDPKLSEFISSAPVVWNGLVFAGLAGSDWAIRGRVMAFDVATGREVWRFNTIPQGSEPGAESWRVPPGVRAGGGGVWTSYTVDPASGELFVSVANPAPDFDPGARLGDNLYTDSMVVLDARTGRLKWWKQVLAPDGFDYDLAAAPALYGDRVALGSKDGHLYIIDRRSRAILHKQPVTTVKTPPGPPTREGVYACPGALGGVEWNGPAVDPAGMIYVGAVDFCATFVLGDIDTAPGELAVGTHYVGDIAKEATGWVTAVDGRTGAVAWRYRTPRPVVAGLTPTAGGLLFTGDQAGTFYAFDRRNGRVLLKRDLGGAIAGGVVTYSVRGRQYVAATAGNISRTVWGTTGDPRLIVMALDARPGPRRALPEVDAFGPVRGGADAAAVGQRTYAQFCAACHGREGGGANAPALTRSALRDRAAIVAFVKNPKAPMPKFFPDPLSEAEVEAVADYIVSLQREKAAGGH